MINNTNLLYGYKIPPTPIGGSVASTVQPLNPSTNLLANYLDAQAVINIPAVKHITPYKNDLRTLFNNDQAKILAIVVRTFNAKDLNGNEYIDGSEQHGTFLNAIDRLDEVKASGFNTLHMLPVHPPGKMKAIGTAGSIYAPKGFLEFDPMLIEPNDPRSPKEQFKAFIDACHERGIRVMLDLPSCASYDMFLAQPQLMAMGKDGLAKTPQDWTDIRMFRPWADESKRILNPALIELHKKYIDMCTELGVDGIRADVSRAKPIEFWDVIIPYSRSKNPEFAWLAETYTYEDASPQVNMPFDRPEDALKCGFDAIYGQYHIFPEWTANKFTDYVKEMLNMSYGFEPGKSLIGSFATHDDVSPMQHGKADYCNLTMGLQATLPMLNPYVVDGYQSGDHYEYSYAGKQNSNTVTDSTEMTVHPGRLDIFNLSRKPGGSNPEIGEFMKHAFELKDKYADIVNRGTFIEFDKEGDKNDDVIAYARHYNGKTLLVVANKNINHAAACKLKVPTLQASQELKNLLPAYGKESLFQAADNELRMEIGPARIHVFTIDTPQIEMYAKNVYRGHTLNKQGAA